MWTSRTTWAALTALVLAGGLALADDPRHRQRNRRRWVSAKVAAAA